MPANLVTLSHSPLIEFVEPQPGVRDRVNEGFATARNFIADAKPDLAVIFAPDHYSGFFYDMMPPFCIGARAEAIGDFGTAGGKLSVDHDVAWKLHKDVLASGIDLPISEKMVVDHGVAQPMEILFGGLENIPVVPFFINSVAANFGPVDRIRKLGEAVGQSLKETGRNVIIIGSGGLSHDPPVPQFETAPERVQEGLINNKDMSAEHRAKAEAKVIEAAKMFARDEAPFMMPLNQEWDNRFMDILGAGNISEIDSWSTQYFIEQAGNSSHEVRTWIAAYAAMSQFGPYEVKYRFYEEIKEWVAGFGINTAITV